MTVRRVIVGERDGRSVLLREDVAPTGPIASQDFIWRCEEPPSVPNDGEISAEDQAFPPPGGVWIMRWVVPAGEALTEGSEMLDLNGGDRPGYHKTDSVDLDLVLSGSIVLQLDDEEVVLNAGDSVVMNGNDHAWRNAGSEPAVMVSVIVGAKRL